MKTKMLVWSDYCASTGFANVMSNILRRLDPEEFEIDVVAVNYRGDPNYDRERFPGKIYPAISSNIKPYDDMWGRQKLLDLLREGSYDTLFMLQDVNVADKIMHLVNQVRKNYGKKFKTVYYFPIDSPPHMKWIKNSVSMVDIPVAYTRYGYECASMSDPKLEHRLLKIPHGVDLYDFYFIEDRDSVQQYRQWHFPATIGKFLLLNVNRNQPRKDIPRSLLLLHELKKTRDDVAMFLHMSNGDIGGDLTPVANQLGLKLGVDYFMPEGLTADGFSIELLNMIYNMSDAVISTSLGEGWGLSLTEAMATRTLVIAPDHSAISEILAHDRGILVKAGDRASLWTVINNDNMVLRPLTNVEDMADKISMLIDFAHRPSKGVMIDRAYDWVIELDWNDIIEQWKPLLKSE